MSEESEMWQRWADERAAKVSPQEKSRHTIEHHARTIRRAVLNAQRDGYTVDFDWEGHLSTDTMTLAIVHKGGRWKDNVRVWPEEK